MKEYTVVAVLFDKEAKNWICVWPALLGQAVGFFMEMGQMEGIARSNGHIIQMAAAGKCRADFQIGNTYIELKDLTAVPYRTDGFIWMNFLPAIKQVLKYCDRLEEDKRIVLLTVCQHGTGQIWAMPGEKIKKEFKKVASMGVEFWVAETKTKTDGVSLLSYQDITCSILDGWQ